LKIIKVKLINKKLLKNNLKLYFVGYKKLLVGAGETESAKDIEVEIIDLESSSSNCSNLKDFPKATHGAISGLDFNDNPVICGGYGNRYKQECFSWSDSSWQVSSPLTQKRRYASSCPSPFPEESYKLMVVGGSDGSDNSSNFLKPIN